MLRHMGPRLEVESLSSRLSGLPAWYLDVILRRHGDAPALAACPPACPSTAPALPVALRLVVDGGVIPQSLLAEVLRRGELLDLEQLLEGRLERVAVRGRGSLGRGVTRRRAEVAASTGVVRRRRIWRRGNDRRSAPLGSFIGGGQRRQQCPADGCRIYLRRLRLRFGVAARGPRAAGAPTACGAGVRAGLVVFAPAGAALLRCSRISAEDGHGCARPVVQAGGTAGRAHVARRAPGEAGGGRQAGRTQRAAPTITITSTCRVHFV